MTFEKDPTPIAVVSRSFSKHPILRKEILERFSNVKFNDEGKSLSGTELVTFLKGCQRAITALEKIEASTLSALPELQLISKYGVGTDMLDIKAMEAHGVRLSWIGGVNRRSVAELALCLAIACLRKLIPANDSVRDGVFKQVIGGQLSGKTFGVIGCGHVGGDLLKLLQPFDCTLLVNDIRDVSAVCHKTGAEQIALEDLLANSDIVSLHVPLNESTLNLLSSSRLSLMKKGAILINTARGGIVDETHLKELLKSGHLLAAAFDVFAVEPPTDLELIRLPGFIATPHIGGSSEEAILAMGRAAIDGLSIEKPCN